MELCYECGREVKTVYSAPESKAPFCEKCSEKLWKIKEAEDKDQ